MLEVGAIELFAKHPEHRDPQGSIAAKTDHQQQTYDDLRGEVLGAGAAARYRPIPSAPGQSSVTSPPAPARRGELS